MRHKIDCTMFHLFVVLFFALTMDSLTAKADEVLVFISAFASGEEGAIHAYNLDTDSGKLALLHRTVDVEHPFFLATSHDGHYLYSIHAPGQFGGKENEQITAFEIAGRGGELKLLNRQSALGTAACYLDVDASGKALVVANYSSGSVASFPLQADGKLTAAATFVQHEGSSVNTGRQEGPHAHSIVISPDNNFAFAADLGLDKILCYKLDADRATLAPNAQPFVRTVPGGGPRHLTFHPNGKHLYLINEIANSISVFDYNSETGVLLEQQTVPTLPSDFEGTSHTADLKVTPDGQFLYGTNRGHDSIASYRVDPNGRLALLDIQPSLGGGPQNLAVTQTGTLLICANMSGGNVAVFRIDPQTGQIQSVGEPVSIPSPSCIMLP